MANVHVLRPDEKTSRQQQFSSPVERIYYEWDKALSQNDPDALLALYAPDAVFESPLVPHLLGNKEGVCRGRDELRPATLSEAVLDPLIVGRKPAQPCCRHRCEYSS